MSGYGICNGNSKGLTNSQFYQNLGFVISHRIIDKLRFRVAADGHVVSNDLVIMEKIFVPS